MLNFEEIKHMVIWESEGTGFAERCDMSLTGETTNTKHTHKWSEAQ
jgi:hypothetical protein